MLNRSSARQMIAGTAFLYTPAIILIYIVFSGLLPLTYFVAIVWSILALTAWLFLRILIDYVGSLRNTFVVIYFPVRQDGVFHNLGQALCTPQA